MFRQFTLLNGRKTSFCKKSTACMNQIVYFTADDRTVDSSRRSVLFDLLRGIMLSVKPISKTAFTTSRVNSRTLSMLKNQLVKYSFKFQLTNGRPLESAGVEIL